MWYLSFSFTATIDFETKATFIMSANNDELNLPFGPQFAEQATDVYFEGRSPPSQTPRRPTAVLRPKPLSNMPLPRGSKRTFEEAANFEESDDEDYDDKAPRDSKSRRNKPSHRGRPARKKRRAHDDDDDDSDLGDTNEEESAEDSFAESEQDEEPVETNEHGRPVRKAAKAAVTYEEPSSEEEIASSSHSEDERKPVSGERPKRLIVKLKTGGTPAPAARNLRPRSGSYGVKHPPTSSESKPRGTRHSSRIAGDEDETVVALTNSGNHVEVIRAGSRDPEGIPARAMKGGKGLKYPSKSTIDEEEDSGRTKDERFEELEIEASQHEILESDPQTQGELEEPLPQLVSDLRAAAADSEDELGLVEGDHGGLPDSENEDDHDEDDEPIQRGRTRGSTKRKATSPLEDPMQAGKRTTRRSLRSSNSKQPARSARRRGADESSDFAPEDEQEAEEHLSASSQSDASPRKTSQRNDEYESSNGRRSRLRKSKPTSRQSPDSEEEAIELQEDLADLKADRPRRRRRSLIVYEERDKRPRGPRAAALNKDYRLLRPELNVPIEDLEEEPSHTPSRKPRGGGGAGGWQRSLLSTYGPFGGAGGLPPVLGGPEGFGAAGGVDSDSSDEENMQRPKPIGGMVGMTPTSALAPAGFGFFNPGQTLNADPAQTTGGTPANLGKIKDKQALADADPLGVDPNVNFDSVGGLEGHIDQLKEMVALPLLYPEIFMRFHVTPPRGVLFHGPPGTGKTLLARALASSVSSQGRKVTFYMRKGADALSKWVGEAERQLRLLFEEARKNQPSIIFFDEIDGKILFSFDLSSSVNAYRSRAGAIQQTRTNSCLHRVDPASSHGWDGWSRSGHCYWCYQ
jgi:ATPase family AAA domain-containing protein 2